MKDVLIIDGVRYVKETAQESGKIKGMTIGEAQEKGLLSDCSCFEQKINKMVYGDDENEYCS